MRAHGEALTSSLTLQLSAQRSCTGAMLAVLQHEVRRTHERRQHDDWMNELVLGESLGKGGFGAVYRGSWKGSMAAIKVGVVRGHVVWLSRDRSRCSLWRSSLVCVGTYVLRWLGWFHSIKVVSVPKVMSMAWPVFLPVPLSRLDKVRLLASVLYRNRQLELNDFMYQRCV